MTDQQLHGVRPEKWRGARPVQNLSLHWQRSAALTISVARQNFDCCGAGVTN
jgi:hypothetical protein